MCAGIVAALALIHEAIAFSIIAGVDPKVGLYASFCIAVLTAIFGGRPGMISTATAATALLMVTLVKEHGLQYLLAATVLTGVLQVIAGALKIGTIMRFVSRSVMTGFVNALAILIFMVQLPEFKGAGVTVYVMVAAALAIIYLLPRVTKAVPSPLVAIIVLSIIPMIWKLDVRTVGDLGELHSTLPLFLWSQVPLPLATLWIVLPYSPGIAAVGLLEPLMTAQIVDEMTDTPSDKNRECTGQSIANFVSGFFWRHGGLRDDRAIGDQCKIRGTRTALDIHRGRLPARAAQSVGETSADARAGRGDDHGLHRHVLVGVVQKPARPSQEHQPRDDRHGGHGRLDTQPRTRRRCRRAAHSNSLSKQS